MLTSLEVADIIGKQPDEFRGPPEPCGPEKKSMKSEVCRMNLIKVCKI